MPGLIETIECVGWCGANATAYAVYWARACEWIFQGMVCNYEHAVEYVSRLSEAETSSL
jgi:hypothetical protein